MLPEFYNLHLEMSSHEVLDVCEGAVESFVRGKGRGDTGPVGNRGDIGPLGKQRGHWPCGETEGTLALWGNRGDTGHVGGHCNCTL